MKSGSFAMKVTTTNAPSSGTGHFDGNVVITGSPIPYNTVARKSGSFDTMLGSFFFLSPQKLPNNTEVVAGWAYKETASSNFSSPSNYFTTLFSIQGSGIQVSEWNMTSFYSSKSGTATIPSTATLTPFITVKNAPVNVPIYFDAMLSTGSIEQSTGYFDGSSQGASWTGTPHNSTSVLAARPAQHKLEVYTSGGSSGFVPTYCLWFDIDKYRAPKLVQGTAPTAPGEYARGGCF